MVYNFLIRLWLIEYMVPEIGSCLRKCISVHLWLSKWKGNSCYRLERWWACSIENIVAQGKNWQNIISVMYDGSYWYAKVCKRKLIQERINWVTNTHNRRIQFDTLTWKESQRLLNLKCQGIRLRRPLSNKDQLEFIEPRIAISIYIDIHLYTYTHT